MKHLSDRYVDFATFSKKVGASNVPYIVMVRDHREELDVAFLNKAITKITFQYGPVRLVDISNEFGADSYIYIVTVARDKHTPKQWCRVFARSFTECQ